MQVLKSEVMASCHHGPVFAPIPGRWPGPFSEIPLGLLMVCTLKIFSHSNDFSTLLEAWLKGSQCSTDNLVLGWTRTRSRQKCLAQYWMDFHGIICSHPRSPEWYIQPFIQPSERMTCLHFLSFPAICDCHCLRILPLLCFVSLLTSPDSSHSCFLSTPTPNSLHILCSAIIPDVQWCQRCLLNPSCCLSDVIQFLSFHLSTNPSTLPAIKPYLTWNRP